MLKVDDLSQWENGSYRTQKWVPTVIYRHQMSPNTHRCRKNLCLKSAHGASRRSLHRSGTLQALTFVWSIITGRQSKLFLFRQNKTRFNTLLHSVRRQSINKLYNYGLILRQTTAVSAFVLLCVQTQPCSLSGRRWEEEDERYSVLLGRWQEKWQHTRRAYGLYVCTRANTRSQQICLKSDRSFTLSLHSSLLSFYCFSSAHHTDKCVLAHTHTARTHARAHHSHTQLTKAQKSFQRTAELQNLWCFNKTICLFSCDEAPVAGANKYKHRYVGSKD